MIDTKPITYADLLEENFDPGAQARGKNYFSKGHVVSISASAEKTKIAAKVSGSKSRLYTVTVDIDWSRCKVDGFCSCMVGYNCKHVVASLLAADMDHQSQSGMPLQTHALEQNHAQEYTSDFNQWFAQFNTLLNTKAKPAAPSKGCDNRSNGNTFEEQLIYSIEPLSYTNDKLTITLRRCRVLKSGGYGKPQVFKPTASAQQKCLQANDFLNSVSFAITK